MKIQTVKLNINPRQPIRAAGFAQQVRARSRFRTKRLPLCACCAGLAAGTDRISE